MLGAGSVAGTAWSGGVVSAASVGGALMLRAKVVASAPAESGGETISVSRLDGNDSGLPQGIVCYADAGGQEKQFNLSEIELASPDQTAAEWVAAYRYWMDNH